MKINDPNSSSGLGFLTVIELPEYGLFGGYLVLNRLGRPLEFHCTAPVKPNRAQQILYGPTLEPYLFGEQIGRALIGAAKTEPLTIFTDREPALALRELVEVPVVLVVSSSDAESQEKQPELDGASPEAGTRPLYRLDAAHPRAGRLAEFHLGRNRVAVPGWAADDRQIVTDRLSALIEGFDLSEPFGRIREAIEEARRGG